MSETYKKRIAAGVCGGCGGPLDPAGTKKYCGECREKNRVKCIDRMRALVADGKCAQCGHPRDAAGNNVNCGECREKNRVRCAKRAKRRHLWAVVETNRGGILVAQALRIGGRNVREVQKIAHPTTASAERRASGFSSPPDDLGRLLSLASTLAGEARDHVVLAAAAVVRAMAARARGRERGR